MAKIKYYYDTETCKYERVKTSSTDVVFNLLGFLSVSAIISIALLFVFNRYFESPAQTILRKENEELHFYYKILDKQVKEANEMLAALQNRDDNIYRVIFEADPIPSTIRKGGEGGADRYKDLLEQDLEKEELIINTFDKIDRVKKQMYIQTKSYDEIVKLATNKSKMWASIPAIQPITNKELSSLASGFGMRIHPIYKVKKMHTGIDFAAMKGTPIYATGDGVIKTVRVNASGYGREIEIDHGFGYVTKYAHMEAFNVKAGQKVKRGECIGFVGNSGTSSGPHVHYEVIKDGVKVDPVHFFFNDLNAEEYEKILELSAIENQSLS